ncbi:ribonuclease H [Senna tora]|uniref:Ribonuclease H n=1 Tax=Senna tora TaxID=362788 RepID=A0A835CII1_9FABA|nr:ribonuclease H [Senna tora]
MCGFIYEVGQLLNHALQDQIEEEENATVTEFITASEGRNTKTASQTKKVRISSLTQGRGRWRRFLGLDVLTAELWGCFHGLTLAWEKEVKKVLLESDSLNAVKLISARCRDEHRCAGLVKLIRNLLDRDWEMVVSHSFRESNFVADCRDCDLKAKGSQLVGMEDDSSDDVMMTSWWGS